MHATLLTGRKKIYIITFLFLFKLHCNLPPGLIVGFAYSSVTVLEYTELQPDYVLNNTGNVLRKVLKELKFFP